MGHPNATPQCDAARPRQEASRATSYGVFSRAEEGATAVEFGLIAMPFFGLLFAIIEVSLAFWTTQVLETAVTNASRQLYTGQFQTDPTNASLTPQQLQTKFKTLVCNNVTGLFDCTSKVSVDVQVPSSGWSASGPPVSGGQYDTSGYGFARQPASGEITIVRASMEYPLYTRLVGLGTGLENGNLLIVASTAFRTEPYTAGN